MSPDQQGDIKEHSSYTHGVDINEQPRESKIEVNESDTLILAPAKNICELPDEQRNQVVDSWFNSAAATAHLTDVESKANSKFRKHKSANFLKALKAAVGNDFFTKV